jgi:hypothetical protein
MIITFHSKAGPDIVMFGDVAKRLLGIVGKEDPGERGIVTVEQLPEAIASLKAAIAADKSARAGKRLEELPTYEPTGDGELRPYVNLANRALPLLDLFERSLRRDTPVTWGV